MRMMTSDPLFRADYTVQYFDCPRCLAIVCRFTPGLSSVTHGGTRLCKKCSEMVRATSTPLSTVLRIQLEAGISSRYNGQLPTSLHIDNHTIFKDWFIVTVGVPGQSRSVNITSKQMQTLHDPALFEGVLDEVLFAIFLLLDEDSIEEP